MRIVFIAHANILLDSSGMQVDFDSAGRHLTEVIQFESRNAYTFHLRIEAMCLLAFARTHQRLFDQAEAALQRALRELSEEPPSEKELQTLHKNWCCALLHQLACVYARHSIQLEKAESCFRQCMVMLYSSGDNCSCADV